MNTHAAVARPAGQRDGIFWSSVAIVIAIKLYVLLSATADVLGDYARPLALADDMLRSSRWLFDADIDKYALPPAAYKIPGYSLLMAGAKLAFGSYWPWGLAILQTAVSFIAGLFVRRFALALGLGSVLSALAFVMYACSVPVSTDTLIMPDSLYGSIVTIVIAFVGVRLLSGKTLSLGDALGIGLAIMVCFWIREIFWFLAFPMALMFVAPFWVNGMRLPRAAILIAIILVPTVLSTAGVFAWNRYRSGDYFLSIVGATVYLIAVLKVAEKVPDVFSGDTPLDRVARRGLSDYDYGDAQIIDEVLFRENGIKAPELARIAQAKYWDTIAHHPGTFALTMWERLRFKQQASMLGDGLMRLDDLDWWRSEGRGIPYMSGWRGDMKKFIDTRDFQYLTVPAILNSVPRAVLRAVTFVLFLLFTFALPIVAVRDLAKRRDVRSAALLGSLYIFYWGVIFIYMLVNVEVRYLSLICSIPIIGTLWTCLRIAQYFQKAPEPASNRL